MLRGYATEYDLNCSTGHTHLCVSFGSVLERNTFNYIVSTCSLPRKHVMHVFTLADNMIIRGIHRLLAYMFLRNGMLPGGLP